MNDMTVPPTAETVLADLSGRLDALSPEQRKAAAWVLENPNAIGLSSVRDIAVAADVKPNTVVRMARQAGFEGFEDFRDPFRQDILRGQTSFPDRARWLQSLKKGGQLGQLYHDMVDAALKNIEDTFAGISEADLRAAAETIWNCRQVFVLGVGVNNSNANNFTYLARTGMDRFHAIPRPGSTAIDDLAMADGRDVMIAVTCKPYRAEVVEAVEVAHEQGVKVVGISDSPASPIIIGAAHGFIVSADTPQFFPSSVSTIALLETLLSFVIAVASDEVVERVERFHKRRHQLGIYRGDHR